MVCFYIKSNVTDLFYKSGLLLFLDISVKSLNAKELGDNARLINGFSNLKLKGQCLPPSIKKKKRDPNLLLL